jgi:hypothetical protein
MTTTMYFCFTCFDITPHEMTTGGWICQICGAIKPFSAQHWSARPHPAVVQVVAEDAGGSGE